VQAAGAQVCSCLDVAEPAIVRVLQACAGSPADRLADLQRQLRCGTQCGSCVPALRRLVAATFPAVAAPPSQDTDAQCPAPAG
jgi:assimilatory nitrate reductase catalytic subunit